MNNVVKIGLLTIILLLTAGISTQAATLTVTKVADTNDGTCNSDCSLREAIAVAVSGDSIAFASPLFDSAQTIVLTLADFNIDKSLTVNGRGMNLTTFSGNGASRLFRVVPGGTLTLNNLTLTGGRDGGNGNKFGGAIINAGSLLLNKVSVSGNSVAGSIISYGGGIYNDTNSSMTATDCTISGNSISGFATDGQGAGIHNAANTTITITGTTISGNAGNSIRDNYGVGIRNFGTMTITGSTISGNTVANASINTNHGGGIYNTGTATIVDSTISGNSVFAGNFSNGGGIFNGGTLTLINGTITLNSANSNFSRGGGGITNVGTMSAVNTIISGNTSPVSPDLQGGLAANVNNFVGGDARLVALGSNGGSTQTHALLSDSPALNAGSSCVLTADACGFTHSAVPFDQRSTGYQRNVGNVDIGAFERGAVAVTNTNLSGSGSLPDVVNSAAPGNVIGFGPLFTTPQSINLFNVNNIVINKDLTIVGPGRNLLTLYSYDGLDTIRRVFYIDGGATLNLSRLRITDAGVPINADDGGAININNGALNANDVSITGSARNGGCIYNNGTLNLSNSLLNSCGSGAGGGIYNETGKTATVTNSTISNNSAVTVAGGAIYNKGTITVTGSTLVNNASYNNTFASGVLVAPGGVTTINNSTISGNRCITQGGGCGAYVQAGGALSITNTTITNNLSNANLTGGVINLGTFTARNSIISGNRNANGTGTQEVSGVITGGGYNLLGSTTGNSYTGVTTGNLVGAANLLPLGNFGGTTETHALLSNSPAIDAGDTTNVFAVDQRGSIRPIGGRGDIGAFERNISFDQTTLPGGTPNSPYSQTLTVTRSFGLAAFEKGDEPSNLAPFAFVLVAGPGLPPGLTLSAGGQITGTPTALGTFVFTVRATDADGMAGVGQITISITNIPPTISGATISRQAGSPVSASTIANVNDTESGAGGVTVTITSANPSNGVTVSNIVNSNGTVTANVIAACGATNASFTLRAIDGGGAITNSTLNVTVTANSAPTVIYASPQSVGLGSSISVMPTTATDNGSIASYSILSVSPALTVAPTVNSSGVVSITNAGPLGNHTITVRATDSCGLTTDASFTLIVSPPVKTVTKIADTDDGVCDSDCSLREAIAAAASGETVQFASPLFNSSQTIVLGSELSVTGKTITITGKGANLTAISGNNQNRVLNVGGGGNLTIDGLTVTGGRDSSLGGGIYNSSTLTITNCAISGNAVAGGNDNFGGGIYNAAQSNLTISGSTISGNSVTGTGNFSNRGGGFANSNGTVTISNSTVHGNSIGGATNNRGGGIYSEYGTLRMINDTISGNFVGSGSFNFGGGLATLNDNVYLTNTIIAGNSASNNPDVLGSFVANDHNLIGGDARLAPLGFYGGTTQTQALMPDSLAINAGNNCVLTASACGNNNPALEIDQRGNVRSIGGTADIGAFEKSISFDQTTIPSAIAEVSYARQLSATRQTSLFEDEGVAAFAPAIFEIVPVAGETLPPGITLSSSGLLSGVPTAAGIYPFTVKATDTDGSAGVQPYSMQVFGPTAANVSVSGRLLTANGQGLRGAVIMLTDPNGNSQMAISSAFGYFRFEYVEAGQTYVVSIQSKRFQFSSQIVSVSDDITDLIFTAQ